MARPLVEIKEGLNHNRIWISSTHHQKALNYQFGKIKWKGADTTQLVITEEIPGEASNFTNSCTR